MEYILYIGSFSSLAPSILTFFVRFPSLLPKFLRIISVLDVGCARQNVPASEPVVGKNISCIPLEYEPAHDGVSDDDDTVFGDDPSKSES